MNDDIIDHQTLVNFCNSLEFEAREALTVLPPKAVADALVGAGAMVATRISSREEAADWLRRIADQFEVSGPEPEPRH